MIPDEIIDRKKQGFGMPTHEWFLEKLGAQTHQTLERFCEQTDFLDKKEVMRLIDANRTTHVWLLLVFAMWWDEHFS